MFPRLAPILALVLVFMVTLAAPARVSAQQAPGRSEAKQIEILRNYAFIVCLAGAYGGLTPRPEALIETIQAEAWVMVERGVFGPEVYDMFYRSSSERGEKIGPQGGILGCLDWRDGKDVERMAREAWSDWARD